MAPNLTSKGQVTIPKKVRDYLGLKAGAAVAFQRLDGGEIAIRAARGPQNRIPAGSPSCADDPPCV
jgi:antitoxin PrlF